MAGETGNTSPDLSQTLLKQGHCFSFFQAVRLLERINKKHLKFRPSLSLDFPESDIEQIKHIKDQDAFEIIATFLGLYGISSPLPAFYTDDLMAAELEDNTSARALLDIIHQHLYSIFFKTLKKYRPLYKVVEDCDQTYPDMLFSFLGLREKTVRKNISFSYQLLRYISLFSQQPRSALGLATLLEDVFPKHPVEVVQCSLRKVKIPKDQQLKLGLQANNLGIDTVLGQQVKDSLGKVTISIGPVTNKQFHHLLNEKWQLLVFLIQFYLIPPIECDIEVIMAENEAKNICLGALKYSCLGRNAWMFTGHERNKVCARLFIKP